MSETVSPPAPHLDRRRKRGWMPPVVVLALLGVIAAIGWPHLKFFLSHESTDNAYVEGRLTSVAPRVSGVVTELLVTDNEPITAGQPLLRLDTSDLEVALAASEAALAQAKADLAAKRAIVKVVQANIDADVVSMNQAESDYARDKELHNRSAISDRVFEQSRSDAEKAEAQHLALEAQIEAARTQIALSEAAIKQRETDIAGDRLHLSYATIYAPVSGTVSRRNVEVGQYVTVGQPLLSLTQNGELWITANFKETQIDRIRPGQKVHVVADAYPDTEFTGRVDSLASATGATFSLLPPDNATGNFVKITQRVPVKILVEGPPDLKHPLRLGLSVELSVAVEDDSGTSGETVAAR